MKPTIYSTPTLTNRQQSLFGKERDHELILNINSPACVIKWNSFLKEAFLPLHTDIHSSIELLNVRKFW